jgi:hypothetical protein
MWAFFLQEDLTKETLHKQYHLVKSHTNTSHVMQYGNKVSGASLSCSPVLEAQADSCQALSLDEEKRDPGGEWSQTGSASYR